MGGSGSGEAENGFYNDIDRASVERNFGNRDDGDEDDDADGYSARVPFRPEDVGRYFIVNVLAEHQVASHRDGKIKERLEVPVRMSSADDSRKGSGL